ncbi:Zinc finger protein 36, C3H1 type-like 1 [Smittium culicis]|uniref:Zinc finger protein 36, C3H1 type-like 1 n=1 Tax=Smittium culicis TaxID=133412 RepID=A0A1R1XSX6_9FUNG|nr:Zinc finger protein 36, C3H1 type-like 1 [Smittium culicis]
MFEQIYSGFNLEDNRSTELAKDGSYSSDTPFNKSNIPSKNVIMNKNMMEVRKKIQYSDGEGSDETTEDCISMKKSPNSGLDAHEHNRTSKNSLELKKAKYLTTQSEPGLFKTEICEKWATNGNCAYGELCRFAHGKSELNNRSRHPKYRTKLCKKFSKTGSCPYGNRCDYLHVFSENGKISSGYKDFAEKKTPNASESSAKNKDHHPNFNKGKYLDLKPTLESTIKSEKNPIRPINNSGILEAEISKLGLVQNSLNNNRKDLNFNRIDIFNTNKYSGKTDTSDYSLARNRYLNINKNADAFGEVGLTSGLGLTRQNGLLNYNERDFFFGKNSSSLNNGLFYQNQQSVIAKNPNHGGNHGLSHALFEIQKYPDFKRGNLNSPLFSTVDNIFFSSTPNESMPNLKHLQGPGFNLNDTSRYYIKENTNLKSDSNKSRNEYNLSNLKPKIYDQSEDSPSHLVGDRYSSQSSIYSNPKNLNSFINKSRSNFLLSRFGN